MAPNILREEPLLRLVRSLAFRVRRPCVRQREMAETERPYREMIAAGEALMQAMEMERTLNTNNDGSVSLESWRTCRLTTALRAEQYAASLRSWRGAIGYECGLERWPK